MEIAACAGFGAAAGIWAWTNTDGVAGIAHGLLAFALALIALVDQRAFRIPDQLSLPLIPLGLFQVWWSWPGELGDHALAALAGAAALYVLNAAYRRLRGFDGLGMGDIKLTAAAGAWVGLNGLVLVILIACAIGLSVVLLSALWRGNNNVGRARLPFGSYESLALLATVFWLL